jgi:ABC-type thiamin/hydroxymethylpyrimidine transport system permease subunit
MEREKKRFLSKFSVYNLIIIALVSALGIATKPIVIPLVHIITGPLFIPGGAVAGGFYMFWLVLGAGMIKKTGTGTLIGLVQAILVIATGTMGTHGIMSIISYTLPGLLVDIIFIFSKNKKYSSLHYVFGCMAANVTGTLISNILFFRLPYVTLILILSAAGLSGAVGGLIAFSISKSLEKMNILEE